jgi:hypothetical protein
MSQIHVERVIGLLVTDEAFRRRFTEDPHAAIEQLAETGVRLTECERHALTSLDPEKIARLADAIDPRLQKSDLNGDLACEEPRTATPPRPGAIDP